MEPSTGPRASVALSGLADDLLAIQAERNPIWASLAGLTGWDDRLPEPAESAERELAAGAGRIAEQSRRLDPAVLTAADRITRAVLMHAAGAVADIVNARVLDHTVSDTFTSPTHGLLVNLPLVPVSDADQAEAYLRRLGAVPPYLAAVADRHRAGLASGRSPVAHLVSATIDRLDRYLADPGGDPLRQPGRDGAPADFAGRRDRVLADVVRPAVADYRRLLADDVLGHARPSDRAGLCWVPGGDDAYAALVRVHTTTNTDPDDLHHTGLELMDGLADEYAELGATVFGTADVATVLHRLRGDPALRWTDPAQILATSRDAVRRAEAAAADWFGRLPAGRCEVRAVPEVATKSMGSAYYTAASLNGTRPGIFFVNTSDPGERPCYQLEAVTFHEAVPGHHLQLALAQELTDLPLLRRLSTPTAYVEGWALYAERLADEMGLYSDDLTRLGMITEDSCRAARLVVDTGLHAHGWSRSRALSYFRTHTAMAELEIAQEVDRYLAEPAQALSYMTGRLEIERLRRAAETTLGPRFTLNTFHNTILTHGALPLPVLESTVNDWLATQ
ncbi:MAG TPA: DUF885 domain-containing protein [Mycobacteriales bacterium]